MSFERGQFTATTKERQKTQRTAQLPMAQILAGAVPVMHALTHDQHWDRYLTYLQGFVETATKQRDAATLKMADPLILAHTDILKYKNDWLIADAIIQTLNIAIGLPKAIIQGGQEAQKFIDEFQRQYGVKHEDSKHTES